MKFKEKVCASSYYIIGFEWVQGLKRRETGKDDCIISSNLPQIFGLNTSLKIVLILPVYFKKRMTSECVPHRYLD